MFGTFLRYHIFVYQKYVYIYNFIGDFSQMKRLGLYFF